MGTQYHAFHSPMKSPYSRLLMAATALIPMTGISNAAIILQDNFTYVDNGTGTNDLNNNLANRQAGSTGTYNWNKTNGTASDSQLGNPSTSAGQPGGTSNRDYMLLAFGGAATSTLELNATVAAGSPISIGFDMFIAPSASDQWIAFNLTSSITHNGFPTVGANNFAFLVKSLSTSTMEVFPGTTGGQAISGAAAGSGTSFTLLLTNTAGTGSAFDGTGSVVHLYRGATQIGTYNPGQFTTEYMTFRAYNGLSGIDNLVVQTVPEPTAALLGSLGLLALARRKRA